MMRLAALCALWGLGCGGNTTPRPGCTLHSCLDAGADGDADGDGDGDADQDGGADGDADGDADPLDCTDPDHDQHLAVGCTDGDDCAEGDPAVFPGGTEVCDGLDNDCDGEVDPDMLVAGADVVIAPVETLVVDMEMAAGASGFGLLEMDSDEVDYTLYFRALGPDGLPTADEPIVLGDTPVHDYHGTTAIASIDDGYLAIWADGPEGNETLEMARIAADGTVTTATVGGSASMYTSALAVGSTTALAVWMGGGATDLAVHYAVVSTADLTLVPLIDDEVSVDPAEPYYPSAVWTGQQYLITFMDGSGTNKLINTAAIHEDGTLLLRDRVASSLRTTAAVGWDDFEAMTAYSDGSEPFAGWSWAMEPDGHLTGEEFSLGPGVRARLAGIPRSFGLVRLTDGGIGGGELQNYKGVVEFAVLGPTGHSSNRMTPDDALEDHATFATVMPADGGWSVAWLGTGGLSLKIDRIVCPE